MGIDETELLKAQLSVSTMWRALSDVRDHLAAAMSQTLSEDPREIVDHVRDALAVARFALSLDGMAVADPRDGELTACRALRAGLSDMIEGGRLTRGAIPDDYDWLVSALASTATSASLGGEGLSR